MQATASNYYISKYYHLARKCGLDADRLLRDADIEPDIIDVPGKRVDAEKLATVLVGIWDALEDEGMSLAGSRIPRGSFYMMGKLTIHEPNLRKALEQIIRFYRFVTNAFTLNLSSIGDTALLTIDLQNPQMDSDHLHSELCLMSLHRYGSWLIAENIPLIEIYFSYPTPPHVKEYSFLFPGKRLFNAPSMGFSFAKKFLDCEVVQTAGTMKRFMHRCPVELFLQPKTDFSLTGEIHSMLSRSVSDGFPTVKQAAEQLHMSVRTLTRKLKDEGATFQQIKIQVRRDRAIYYLTSRNYSVGVVAERVGFSDPAVFARAFKSWTGLSPKEYRASYGRSRDAG